VSQGVLTGEDSRVPGAPAIFCQWVGASQPKIVRPTSPPEAEMGRLFFLMNLRGRKWARAKEPP